ncbi:MAG: HAD-IIIA family hydrolase, partial [Bacteroidota bacterium]
GFVFEHRALEAISILSKHFEKIFVITNQQGIGKGLMSEKDVNNIHKHMLQQIVEKGGKVDAVFFCPHLYTELCLCRKPNIGLALKARKQFPEIQFSKSIMVGDTLNDMLFGKKLKMRTVLINQDINMARNNSNVIDSMFDSLYDFASILENNNSNPYTLFK